jgi:GNAT superfamily N-acetyltransferase
MVARDGARVRLATAEDLPRLIQLLDQLSLDAPQEQTGPPLPDAYREALNDILVDERQQLLVLEDQGTIMGTVTLITIPNLTHQGRPHALVENLVVDESRRGTGYGEILMRRAIEDARRAGCYKLALSSNKRRPEAHLFYRRLGLEATSEGFRINL